MNLKPLFVVCTEEGILASELSRFPKVIEKLATRIAKSAVNRVLSSLNRLWAARESIGFGLVDDAGLQLLSRLLPDESGSVQTAYIPPRIWIYQNTRLRECLDDYAEHREKVEECFRFCVAAYAKNAGSIARSFGVKLPHLQPFNTINIGKGSNSGREYHGKFELTAKRMGVYELIDRWVGFSEASGVKKLSTYLNLVDSVGIAYILNFSLMRVDEAARLRANCLVVERDAMGEEVYLLRGETSKTIAGDASWIVPRSVAVAVDAMSSIARLRAEVAAHDPRIKIRAEDLTNPLLLSRPSEPWRSRRGYSRRSAHQYCEVIGLWPKLFDLEELRLTKSDLEIANRMTFGLDESRFAIGVPWPISWHQLRRTGAVNMLGSGVVSESSLQYQLKHFGRAMTRYYGQNYYRLNVHLDEDARGYYLREMYNSVVRDFLSLQSDRFISPHGDKRKAQILSVISDKDHAGLLRAAAQGRISYRQTFMGGCAKLGDACPLGGITNISGCMGWGDQKPCQDALLDKQKRGVVEALKMELEAQLVSSPPNSFAQTSLRAQIESLERYLYVTNAK